MNSKIKNFLISQNNNIKDAISIINKNGGQIVLVIDKENKLIGTITDGDIRRALLQGKKLNDNVKTIFNKNYHFVSPKVSKIEALEYMSKEKLHQLPVIDKDRKLLDIFLLDNLLFPKILPNYVVIMAGGLGKRLGKLTEKTPKPLLPIDGTPMIEIIIKRYQQSGLKNFLVSVNFEKEKIKAYLGDGSKFNACIKYIEEKKPLGTAGSLSLIEIENNNPIIVTNGDVLTKVDFVKLLEFHKEEKSDFTICSTRVDTTIPFGVLLLQNNDVKSIQEKPKIENFINSGVYVINSNVLNIIKKNEFLNMDELISKVIDLNMKVKAFPLHEYWIDAGKPETYDQAIRDWK